MSEIQNFSFTHLEEATIVELQAAITAGELTTQRLVEMYIECILYYDR